MVSRLFALCRGHDLDRRGKALDYESPALTAELQAPRARPKINAFRPVTNPESIRGCSNSECFREQAAELQARIFWIRR